MSVLNIDTSKSRSVDDNVMEQLVEDLFRHHGIKSLQRYNLAYRHHVMQLSKELDIKVVIGGVLTRESLINFNDAGKLWVTLAKDVSYAEDLKQVALAIACHIFVEKGFLQRPTNLSIDMKSMPPELFKACKRVAAMITMPRGEFSKMAEKHKGSPDRVEFLALAFNTTNDFVEYRLKHLKL